MKTEQALFGERFRTALKNAGYPASPSEISRQLTKFGMEPITPQAISSWLHGKSIPRQKSVLALAEMLRIDPMALQYGHDSNGRRIREQQTPFRVNAPDQHAMDAYLALSMKHRKIVREIIEALSEPHPKR
jgi:transcriptional regulator with XRE-family HTH domain